MDGTRQTDSPQPNGQAAGEAKRTEAGGTSGRAVPPSHVVLFLLLAVGGAALDLWTKAAVFDWRGLPGQRDVYWVIDGYFGIETAVNTGALFGLGAGRGTLFAAMSVIAGAGILVWLFWFGAARSTWLTVALGCVTGGILGNLYDRLGLWWEPGFNPAWQSGVRDWILWQAGEEWKWPNFNIADSLLVIGAGMLLYQSFFPPPLHEEEGPSGEAEPGRRETDDR